MAKYNSEKKLIPHSSSEVFAVLSNLNNLELAKDKIPSDKLKDISFDKDSCTVSVDPIGNIKFSIVERLENSSIKFQAERIPFPLSMYIKLNESDANNTELVMEVDADLNPFIKPMVSKPLQEGLDKIAEILAILPYKDINSNEEKA